MCSPRALGAGCREPMLPARACLGWGLTAGYRAWDPWAPLLVTVSSHLRREGQA